MRSTDLARHKLLQPLNPLRPAHYPLQVYHFLIKEGMGKSEEPQGKAKECIL